MAFVKIDPDLYGHPKVMTLGSALGLTADQAGDLCVRFWCWCKRYAEIGRVTYSSTQLEAGLRWPLDGKFLDGMKQAGLIDEEGWVNDWPEWGGAEMMDRARKNPNKYSEFIKRYGNSRNFLEFPGNSGKPQPKKKTPEEPKAPQAEQEKPAPVAAQPALTLGDEPAKPTVAAADIEACYAAYPAKRENQSSTGKTLKDKDKIKVALAKGYPMIDAIKFHVATANRGYYKNLSTFLNNLPDPDEVRRWVERNKPRPKAAPAPVHKCAVDSTRWVENARHPAGGYNLNMCHGCGVETLAKPEDGEFLMADLGFKKKATQEADTVPSLEEIEAALPKPGGVGDWRPK